MKDGVMINAQAYHDTSLSNLLLTEKCSTGLSVNYKCRARVTLTPRSGKLNKICEREVEMYLER